VRWKKKPFRVKMREREKRKEKESERERKERKKKRTKRKEREKSLRKFNRVIAFFIENTSHSLSERNIFFFAFPLK